MNMKHTPVINIRGNNGSGKTFLVTYWMDRGEKTPFPRVKNLLGSTTLMGTPTHYELEDGGIVVGNYDRIDGCNGCDALKTPGGGSLTFAHLRTLLKDAVAKKPKYVLFEGIIISTVFESWYNYSKSIGGMHWVYIDTPFEECLARVTARNKGKKFNETMVKDKHRQIASTQRRAKEAGEKVTVIDWKDTVTQFDALMKLLFR